MWERTRFFIKCLSEHTDMKINARLQLGTGAEKKEERLLLCGCLNVNTETNRLSTCSNSNTVNTRG